MDLTLIDLLTDDQLKLFGLDRDVLSLVINIPKTGRPTSRPALCQDRLGRLAADVKLYLPPNAVCTITIGAGQVTVEVDGKMAANDYLKSLLASREGVFLAWFEALHAQCSRRVGTRERIGRDIGTAVDLVLDAYAHRPDILAAARLRPICHCCMLQAEPGEVATFYRRLSKTPGAGGVPFNFGDSALGVKTIVHDDAWYDLIISVHEAIYGPIFAQGIANRN